MKTKYPSLFFLSAFSAASLLFSPCSRADGPYRFIKEIAVGGEGGWDYLAVDADARRFYVSHATKVVVIDIDKDAIIGEIADTPGAHGIAIAPELQLGFTSNGKENKVSAFELKTLKTLFKVDTSGNPDAILYEPERQEVYAFNGHGQSATVFEAKSGKVIATIPLPGKPEFAAVDPKAGFVYCNIEDKSQIVAIDAKTHQVASRWPIAPGEEASGMTIDLANHRLFIGCHSQVMEMIDSASGKVIASVPIGKGVDANAFDPGAMFAFSSNGEGDVTVAHEETPDKLVPVQTLQTEPGARTMALDPKTHRIYLASAKFEAAAEGAPGAGRKRPAILPGTFKILVYGTEQPSP